MFRFRNLYSGIVLVFEGSFKELKNALKANARILNRLKCIRFHKTFLSTYFVPLLDKGVTYPIFFILWLLQPIRRE